jgi:hypothetical protein
LAAAAITTASCSQLYSGSYRVWRADCSSETSLYLQRSLVPGKLETGDDLGWGVFYRAGQKVFPLYDDGVSPNARHSAARAYVGWAFNGHVISNVGPTDTYTPLPLAPNVAVSVFDKGAVIGDHEDAPDADPELMNIFIDPRQMPTADFNAMKTCLFARQQNLNRAMARLPGEVPSYDAKFLHVLKLGGLVYGLPPFQQQAYAAALDHMRAAKTIPAFGRFILYPGDSASAVFSGHTVRVKENGVNNPQLYIDGKLVVFASGGASSSTYVDGLPNSWVISGPICTKTSRDCGVAIMVASDNTDMSETFTVATKISPNGYALDPAWAPEPKRWRSVGA